MANKYFSAKEEQTTEGVVLDIIAVWSYQSPEENDGSDAQLDIYTYNGNDYGYSGIIATAIFMALQSAQRKEDVK